MSQTSGMKKAAFCPLTHNENYVSIISFGLKPEGNDRELNQGTFSSLKTEPKSVFLPRQGLIPDAESTVMKTLHYAQDLNPLRGKNTLHHSPGFKPWRGKNSKNPQARRIATKLLEGLAKMVLSPGRSVALQQSRANLSVGHQAENSLRQ